MIVFCYLILVISEPCQNVDQHFSSIPTKQEAIQFIKKETDYIIRVIEQENSELKLEYSEKK
ncbi:MAG: hypothetical protein H0T62_05390 [Parachlamydiaceae bacterium]|nr:hypothetical protein [Parachlamydiaceae bacterium]